MEKITSSNCHQDITEEQESSLQDPFSTDQTAKPPQFLLQTATGKDNTTTLVKIMSCKHCVTQNNPSCRLILGLSIVADNSLLFNVERATVNELLKASLCSQILEKFKITMLKLLNLCFHLFPADEFISSISKTGQGNEWILALWKSIWSIWYWCFNLGMFSFLFIFLTNITQYNFLTATFFCTNKSWHNFCCKGNKSH